MGYLALYVIEFIGELWGLDCLWGCLMGLGLVKSFSSVLCDGGWELALIGAGGKFSGFFGGYNLRV